MYLFCNLRIVLISWSQSLICDKQINPFLTLSNRTFFFFKRSQNLALRVGLMLSLT